MNSEVDRSDQLLTVKQLAELLGIAPASVYHWISAGRLPVIRLSKRCVRFRRSEIFSMLAKLNQPAHSDFDG